MVWKGRRRGKKGGEEREGGGGREEEGRGERERFFVVKWNANLGSDYAESFWELIF